MSQPELGANREPRASRAKPDFFVSLVKRVEPFWLASWVNVLT
jgi:hypothetical protein